MPNDFSASGTVGHRFVLLDDFQHCGLSVRIAHEICSRARVFRLLLPIIDLCELCEFSWHAEHRGLPLRTTLADLDSLLVNPSQALS